MNDGTIFSKIELGKLNDPPGIIAGRRKAVCQQPRFKLLGGFDLR
ncbi:hypothetical protein [Mesorhizobium marinum]|uniref:Uncharacterized protein n=1 Tax=Mesorhizobium marinum TaxID=3228790 RepID=A0ABV3R1F0_9HYPH